MQAKPRVVSSSNQPHRSASKSRTRIRMKYRDPIACSRFLGSAGYKLAQARSSSRSFSRGWRLTPMWVTNFAARRRASFVPNAISGSTIGARSNSSRARHSKAACLHCGVAVSSRTIASSSGRNEVTAGEPDRSSRSNARKSPPPSRTIIGRIASTISGEKNPDALKFRQRSTRRKKGSSASNFPSASRRRYLDLTERRDGSPFERTA